MNHMQNVINNLGRGPTGPDESSPSDELAAYRALSLAGWGIRPAGNFCLLLVINIAMENPF